MCCQRFPHLFSLCFCDRPLPLPPLRSPMGRSSQDWPVQRGPSGFEGFSRGGKGESRWRHGAETKALCCETIHQISWRSVPLSRSRPGQNISSSSVCRCVLCVLIYRGVCTRVWNLISSVRKIQRDGLTLLLLFTVPHTHTYTHSHTQLLFCSSVFSCSLQSTSSCCPKWAELSWSSQSVFLFVFEYCILLFLFKLPLV